MADLSESVSEQSLCRSTHDLLAHHYAFCLILAPYQVCSSELWLCIRVRITLVFGCFASYLKQYAASEQLS